MLPFDSINKFDRLNKITYMNFIIQTNHLRKYSKIFTTNINNSRETF